MGDEDSQLIAEYGADVICRTGWISGSCMYLPPAFRSGVYAGVEMMRMQACRHVFPEDGSRSDSDCKPQSDAWRGGFAGNRSNTRERRNHHVDGDYGADRTRLS